MLLGKSSLLADISVGMSEILKKNKKTQKCTKFGESLNDSWPWSTM